MTPKEQAFIDIDKALAILNMRIQGSMTAGMNLAEVFSVRLDMTNITTFIKHQVKTLKEEIP